MRVKINLIGGGFSHTLSTNETPPKFIEWVGSGGEISLHVDNGIMQPTNPETINYGWLCESKTINPNYYNWCQNNINTLRAKFVKVFTHDVELAMSSDIFQLTQCSGKSFIQDGQIYPKTKLVSMIASNKIMCPEHYHRQSIIQKYSSQCDHFGRGFNPIENKVDGLRDYCFSFAMENATYPNMFTEKITDCFMCGTIPIYYGISNIGDFFDTNGIIMIDDNFNLNDLTFELYQDKIESVKKNLALAIDLLLAEDYIYLNYIKDYGRN